MKPEKVQEFKEILSRIEAKDESLIEVDLQYFNLDVEDVLLLAQALPQSNLTSLDLGGNRIGEAGAVALSLVLPQSSLTSLNLRGNKIGEAGAVVLSLVLPQSSLTSLNLMENDIGEAGAVALSKGLAQSSLTSLNFGSNNMGAEGAAAIAAALPQSQVTSLILENNNIGDEGAAVIAAALPQSQLRSLNLWYNNIGAGGAAAIAAALPQSQLRSLDLEQNNIGDAGAVAIAAALPQSQLRSLDLEQNNIGDAGAAALAAGLPQSQLTSLNLGGNYIGDEGAAALAAALPQSQLTSLDLGDNHIGAEGAAVLLRAVNSNYTMTDLRLELDENQKAILNNHRAINELLSAVQPEDKSTNEFIQELEGSALMYIGQPKLLDDATFEKPKRLLLKAIKLGSVQAIYLLGNLYLNELKDLAKAKEYYSQAALMGHAISKLCSEIMGQTDAPTKLKFGDLTLKLPRRFSANTNNQKLVLREHELTNLRETNVLVSKTGISLPALNELHTIEPSMSVFVATKDYEPIDAGHLHFSQGQTIYIKNVGDIAENFAMLVKDGLPKCFIPYNRDKQGRKRADAGFIPCDIFLSCQQKQREDWSAEDVCNAIITPKTKPAFGEKSKPYVDILPENQRGKAFEGYILSYARSSKFTNILESLNERFRDRNPDEVFIWIDLAGINQHAWMEMDSSAIGKILEVNLTQLFTHVSDGRLIHFDKARPTNLTRSWCLVELLSCLKAQEHTVAQTEICMASGVQAEVLAQDLMGLLDALDASKAQCFNPVDKIAIDAQIKRALLEEGETNISMEIAFARLSVVVKSWLLTKFLPDFRKIVELKNLQQAQTNTAQEEEKSNVAMIQLPSLRSAVDLDHGVPLTVAYNSKAAMASPLLEETAAVSLPPTPAVATGGNSRFEALRARFQPRAKNNFS